MNLGFWFSLEATFLLTEANSFASASAFSLLIMIS